MGSLLLWLSIYTVARFRLRKNLLISCLFFSGAFCSPDILYLLSTSRRMRLDTEGQFKVSKKRLQACKSSTLQY
jgi:hypothetical protein